MFRLIFSLQMFSFYFGLIFFKNLPVCGFSVRIMQTILPCSSCYMAKNEIYHPDWIVYGTHTHTHYSSRYGKIICLLIVSNVVA